MRPNYSGIFSLSHWNTAKTILVLFLIFVISACGQPDQKKPKKKGELRGTISISGAFALYPLAIRWAEEFRKIHPGVRIDISAGGAGKGLTDALHEMVDLGMFSRSFTQAELDRGVWYLAVTIDAVVPTINDQNPYYSKLMERGITQAEFQEIYLHGTITHWQQLIGSAGDDKIHVYTRSDASGAAQVWAEYLGKHQENLQGIGVFGDPGIASAVKTDELGIGYNNLVFIYDMTTRKPFPGMSVLPIDINSNGQIDPEEDFYETIDSVGEAIRIGKYPSPPARPLYFVAGAKPQKDEVIAFLSWILVEGQQFVGEAGYVALSDSLLKHELKKLE